MKSIIVVAALLLAGCQSKQRVESRPVDDRRLGATLAAAVEQVQTTEPCPKEAQDAVLNKLYPVLGEQPEDITEHWIRDREAKLACVRDWANGLPVGCQKDQYAEWLDFYAARLQRNREDLSKQKPVSEHDKWAAEEKERQKRIKAYEALHPVPKPPSCDIELIRKVRP